VVLVIAYEWSQTGRAVVVLVLVALVVEMSLDGPRGHAVLTDNTAS